MRFDYGLLIGHEDFRLIPDETGDIFVTFPHRSIQEFLGALYFILCLLDGVSVQSLLGHNPEKSLFLQNQLFFCFANWVTCGSKDYFPTIQQKCGKAAEALKLYILEHMDQVQLDLRCLTSRFPSLDIGTAVMKKDEVSLSILAEVLGSFRNVRDLNLYDFLPLQWNVLWWILGKLLPLLETSLRSIMVSRSRCSFMPCIETDGISIGLRGIGVDQSHMIVDLLMRLCSSADRKASVFIFSLGQSVDGVSERLELFSIVHENIRSLHVLETKPYIAPSKKPKMPLQRLCLKIASTDLVSDLSRHMRNGSLSRLTDISIATVPLVGCLFEKEWSQLTHLTLSKLTGEAFNELSEITKQGKLRNISELSLIFIDKRLYCFSRGNILSGLFTI